MRTVLDDRGVDLIEMQLQIYRKAIDAFDNGRGQTEKGDPGPAYLAVANQAVATLAKYAYPTMTAVKLEDANSLVNAKVLDAAEARKIVLNDPFAKHVGDIAQNPQELGAPVLPVGKKDD